MAMTRGHTLPAAPKHVNRFGKYTLNLDRENAGPGLHAQPASRIAARSGERLIVKNS